MTPNTPQPGVSVIITNYNSRHLLADTVRHVETAAAEYGGPVEIILVDDASPKGDGPLVEREFGDKHRVIVNPVNLGYSGANNAGVAAARHEYVLTLNSDMRLEPDFFRQAMPHFQNPDVFAIAAQSVNPETGAYEGGCNGLGFWRGNFLTFQEGAEIQRKTRLSSHAGGGSTYRKDLYLKFGGYSDLYTPFYWEDTDLAVAAYLNGYRVIYAHECRFRHHHDKGAIRGNFQEARIRTIQTRNRNLFLWKFTQPLSAYRLRHVLWLPILILLDWLRGRNIEARALWAALHRLPALRKEPRADSFPKSIEDLVARVNQDRCKLQFEPGVWSDIRTRKFPRWFNDIWVQMARLAGGGRRVLAMHCPAQDLVNYLVWNGNAVSAENVSGVLDISVAEALQPPSSDGYDLILIGKHGDPLTIAAANRQRLRPGGRILLTLQRMSPDAPFTLAEIAGRAAQAGFAVEASDFTYILPPFARCLAWLPRFGTTLAARWAKRRPETTADAYQLLLRPMA